jgi:hypothetical protein
VGQMIKKDAEIRVCEKNEEEAAKQQKPAPTCIAESGTFEGEVTLPAPVKVRSGNTIQLVLPRGHAVATADRTRTTRALKKPKPVITIVEAVRLRRSSDHGSRTAMAQATDRSAGVDGGVALRSLPLMVLD